MDFNKMSLFGMVKSKLNWLGQRQEVLAQNIANSDTPRYRASDLKPYNFEKLVRKEAGQLNMVSNDPSHLPGRRVRIRDYSSIVERRPFETMPNGNAVVLEEQMAKINETQVNHSLMTQLYKKHLSMIRMSIGK
jgi:flagellar basal-body rod protein FlgB